MESTFIKSVNIKPFNGKDEEYHANKMFISASGLKRLKKSPAHFKEEEDEKETDALLFGSAYHCFILEPERFEKEYYVFDDAVQCEAIIAKGASEGKEVKNVRATKEYKTWKDSAISMADGKILIDKYDFETLQAMKEKLFRHPYAKFLLTNGINEQGYTGTIETEAGTIPIKFKPDHQKPKKRVIVDLKTTKDASAEGFPKQAAENNMHIQAAFYADMMELLEGEGLPYSFIFIAQEKKKPFAFNLFEASPQFISQGRWEYEMLLQMYKYCLDNNYWPGYQIFCQNQYGILELKLPPWGIKDITYYDHLPKNRISNKEQLVLTN